MTKMSSVFAVLLLLACRLAFAQDFTYSPIDILSWGSGFPIATGALSNSPPEEKGGPDSADCQAFIKKLPDDYIRGYVQVPEDPDNANSPKLQIFYYGQLFPDIPPVAFFNGGPTGSSWSSFDALQITDNPELKNVPFIFIDQRGTGCSSPYPQLQSFEDLPRLALYASSGIVADAEAVRTKLLGNRPWKILGQSYGGLIVHRYVVQAPQSLISATSHGFALTNDPFQTLLERVASQNRVLKALLEEFPEDEARLADLNQDLTPDRCFEVNQGQGKRCGKNLLEPLRETLGFVSEWPIFNSLLNDFSIDRWAAKFPFLPKQTDSPFWATKYWADQVIWHNDMNFALANRENCMKIFTDLENDGENPESWLLNECQASMEGPPKPVSRGDRLVAHLPKNLILPSEFRETLLAHPNLKFFLYSGELDPYSPVAIFQDELGALGDRVVYQHFAKTGHDGFFTEPNVLLNLE